MSSEGLTSFEIQILLEIYGVHQLNLTLGAAMWQAYEFLKESGYVTQGQFAELTQVGEDKLLEVLIDYVIQLPEGGKLNG